jgi:SAM-dependent methyltransferase
MARIRESGMPERQAWEDFFEVPRVLAALNCGAGAGDILEFGCGYGTFTVAAAQCTAATVYALDIDPDMVAATAARAMAAGVKNVVVQQCDFMNSGSGRPANSVGFAMLFNILHLEEPQALLREVHRVLHPGGSAAIIHWRVDIPTPRGPPAQMRPSPQQSQRWAEAAGFHCTVLPVLPGAPWHWGMLLQRH